MLAQIGGLGVQDGSKLGVVEAMLAQFGEDGGSFGAILAPYWSLVGKKKAPRTQDGRKGGPKGGEVHGGRCK